MKTGLLVTGIGIILGLSLIIFYPIEFKELLSLKPTLPFISQKENDTTESLYLESFDTMNIDIDMGDIRIIEGQNYHIDIEYCASCKYQIHHVIKENSLNITSSKVKPYKFLKNEPSPMIQITIPKDTFLSNTNIKTKFGTIKIKDQYIETLIVEADLGDVSIEGSIKKLELKLSMGKAEVLGNINQLRIENELGQSTVKINGLENDYETTIESSLGSISVGGTKQTGFDKIYKNNHQLNLDKTIYIKNEMGDVELNFDN